MRKLLILQAMGCILFAIIIIILHILNIFSPISVIILYFIMGIANIINARIMLIKPIEEISTHDELTGCYNRIKLDSKIGEYENYKTYAIIFFDLNNLKSANDTHGHDYGDTILIRASNQLRYWHTYGDLYRIGGDEFIVVVPNAIKNRLEKILNKWYDTLSILNTDYNDQFICNFSYGIAYKTKNSPEKFATILEEADRNMYQMKSQKGIHNGARR